MSFSARSEVPIQDTWDLTPLYSLVSAWESDFRSTENDIELLSKFRGTLSQSSARLAEGFEMYLKASRALDRIYTYAHLRSDEDTTNPKNLALLEQARSLYARFQAASSFLTPEILRIDTTVFESFLKDPKLKPYQRMLEEIVRYKPHTLSESEENILALGSEVISAPGKIFSQLNDADLDFGTLEIDGAEAPLTHGTLTVFLKNEDRTLRERAYRQYYGVFEKHQHTIAATLSSSLLADVYMTRARKFTSCRGRSLFADDVDLSVYDNLVRTVSENLKPLHKYHELRKRVLNLPELQTYDMSVPLVGKIKTDIPYAKGCEYILEAMRPLGEDYITVLKSGLLKNRWVDVYENRGKRSGAYSSGCYDSPPYMLMNYKQNELNDLFTLAHEAGHSMHSYYSHKHQPYQDSSYTIFVAEVASTLNEQLLGHHLRGVFKNDKRLLAHLVNQEIEEINGTLYRQTLFAEFESITHEMAESHKPLTAEVFRNVASDLHNKYFGDVVTAAPLSDLLGLRIPHFYSAFYVYKYATGISAAIALAQGLLKGGSNERYLRFLQSGCTKYPLELLAEAGVDMRSPKPIEAAIAKFSELVTELEGLLT